MVDGMRGMLGMMECGELGWECGEQGWESFSHKSLKNEIKG